MTDRELVVKWWDEAWSSGLWAASWSASVDKLTPDQAAWTPTADRHSIWQVVLHMIFWRESWLRRVATGEKPTEDQVARLNFPTPPDSGSEDWPGAWAEARRHLADTQERVASALRDPKLNIDSFIYLLPHDCYHFGQVNYLRALQGLMPIE